MIIRQTNDADLNIVLFIEREAFNSNAEADLVREILADPSAKPLLSLIAIIRNQAVGHILFTTAHLSNNPNKVSISLLAPLAIIPKYQKQGIGGKLIKKGLELLSKSGVDIVFVLGHPKYYPRHGFIPASNLGFEAPYPIPKEVADAWMVQPLRPNVMGTVSGKVICCEALNKPEHWRE
jgi:putative acetyltransferase